MHGLARVWLFTGCPRNLWGNKIAFPKRHPIKDMAAMRSAMSSPIFCLPCPSVKFHDYAPLLKGRWHDLIPAKHGQQDQGDHGQGKPCFAHGASVGISTAQDKATDGHAGRPEMPRRRPCHLLKIKQANNYRPKKQSNHKQNNKSYERVFAAIFFNSR